MQKIELGKNPGFGCFSKKQIDEAVKRICKESVSKLNIKTEEDKRQFAIVAIAAILFFKENPLYIYPR